MTDSTVRNTAPASGSTQFMNVNTGSEVIISRSEFSDNDTRLFKISNGSLQFSDSKVEKTVSPESPGAVFYVDATGQLDIYNSEFLTNKVENQTDSDAGVVRNSGTANIYNSRFEGNSATLGTTPGAGAVANSIGATMTVKNSEFVSNSSRSGGAIYDGNGSKSLTIDNTIFTGNTAIGVGGAIASNSDQHLTITDSVFGSNVAEIHGGAIRLVSSGAVIKNTDFISNTAGHYGGAVSVDGTSTNKVIIAADQGISEFKGNIANGESNAIWLINSNVYLTSSKSGQLHIADKIGSNTINNQVIINAADTVTEAFLSDASGVVQIEDTISDATVKVEGGTLKLGSWGKH